PQWLESEHAGIRILPLLLRRILPLLRQSGRDRGGGGIKMCGIAGLYRDAGVSEEHVDAVRRALAAEGHRGPDADGLWQGDRAVLGHRRLAILDLSEAGRQPMSNEDGSVRVTYNGEIYNYLELRRELVTAGHSFRSQTDTEVLLHGYEEWGAEGLLNR